MLVQMKLTTELDGTVLKKEEMRSDIYKGIYSIYTLVDIEEQKMRYIRQSTKESVDVNIKIRTIKIDGIIYGKLLDEMCAPLFIREECFIIENEHIAFVEGHDNEINSLINKVAYPSLSENYKEKILYKEPLTKND